MASESPAHSAIVAGPIRTAEKKPFLHRLSCCLKIWALKVVFGYFAPLKRLITQKPVILHTTTKTYSCRPGLENRIFYPTGWKSGTTLPLYLSIHGGGFTFGQPSNDDAFNRKFADHCGVLVVSVNYRKAPLHPFPTGVQDVAAICSAIIDDKELPIDKDRVAIGGFSAGGNLSLAATQLPGLQGKVRAALPWYAPMNWTIPLEERVASRAYNTRHPKEMGAIITPLFDWAFIPPGTDLTNPRVSVALAEKKDIPEWVFVIAGEYDMFGEEARALICRLADVDMSDVESRFAFEKGKYRWILAREVGHGFTHPGSNGELEAERVAALDFCYDSVKEWLWKGPFA